jgi:hypothetical protein
VYCCSSFVLCVNANSSFINTPVTSSRGSHLRVRLKSRSQFHRLSQLLKFRSKREGDQTLLDFSGGLRGGHGVLS